MRRPLDDRPERAAEVHAASRAPRASALARRSNWLRLARGVSVAGAAGFVGAVLTLQVLRSNLNPAVDTISQYSLGSYGWIIRAAFVVLGLVVLSTVVSLYHGVASAWGRVGTCLLGVTACGVFLDAAYNTDRLRVPETFDGRIHGIGTFIFCLTLPVATFVLSADLIGTSLAAPARRLQALGCAQLIAALGFELGPTAYRGLTERVGVLLVMVTLALLQSVARRAADGEANVRRTLVHHSEAIESA